MKIHIILISVIIVISGCSSQPVKNHELEDLKAVTPSGWKLAEEKASSDEILKFRITSDKKCTREFLKMGTTEEITPSLTVTYTKKWTQEQYSEENKKYEECKKELAEAPMRAYSCEKKTPNIDTKSYSVFIADDKCSDETDDIKAKILNHLKSE